MFDEKLEASDFDGRSCCINRSLSKYINHFDINRKDLKKTLHKKDLLLVGGGKSPIKKTLSRLNISCNVTNVDPFVISGPDCADTLIAKDFTETNFVNKFDECWALYSLPLYSLTIEHAESFYVKAAIALKPGGILRVCGTPHRVDGILIAPHFPRCMRQPEMLVMELGILFNDIFYDNLKFEKLTERKNSYTKFEKDRDKYFQYWQAPKKLEDKILFNELIKQQTVYRR